MRPFWRLLLEGMGGFLAALALELAAGGLLEARLERLVAISYILFLVPAVNNMAGTLGTIMVARLSTALHLGTLAPTLKRSETLAANLQGVAAVGSTTLLYLVLLTQVLARLLGAGLPNPLGLAALVVLAGGLAVILVVATSILLSLGLFRQGLDPSVAVMPVITAVGDIYGVGSLLGVAYLLGLL
jgi:mgtE-like transporter